jgi:hypothetical protein
MATDGATLERHAKAQFERWNAFVRDTHIKLEL